MMQKQVFTQDERDRIVPKELGHTLMNNLKEFDNSPDKIKAIIDKFEQLNDANYNNPLKTFVIPFDKVYKFYEMSNHFPDIYWIEKNVPDFDIKRVKGGYSLDIYESFVNHLDRLILRLIASRNIGDDEDFTDEGLDKLIALATEYKNRKNTDVKRLTKEEIIGLQRKREERPPGVKTGIEEVDDVIVELPIGNISVINAPSGAGKSLTTSNILYNNAVLQGKHVIYVAYEAQEDELWANLASIQSFHEKKPISHSTWKLRKGGDEGKEERIRTFEENVEYVMDATEKSKGYINILTHATMAETTFEDFCSRLEKEREIQGKKVDLIVIDNIDNLGMYPYKGTDSRTIMNNRIIHLDTLSRTFCNNEGTHILLLSQSNREGIKKLEENERLSRASSGDSYLERKSKKQKHTIDYTIISDYSALYQKAAIAIVLLISDRQGENDIIKMYFLKVRGDRQPEDPIEVKADLRYCKVGGKIEVTSVGGYLEYQALQDEIKEQVAKAKETNDAPPIDLDFMED